MSGTQFTRHGPHLTVKPEGRLDLPGAAALEKELTPQLAGAQTVTMDLEGVEYITSAGLRLLMIVDQEMEARRGGMKVIHANEAVLGVFRIAGLMYSLDIEAD